MAQLDMLTKSGVKGTGKVSLPAALYGAKTADHTLLKQIYARATSNQRVVSANTLTRGEVRGGGRKPWRQKGTGRARAGSNSSPLWRGGGVTFGPSAHANYRKKAPRTMRAKALAQSLALAYGSGRLLVVQTLDSVIKTNHLSDFLRKARLERRTVIVTEGAKPALQRAAANLKSVSVVTQAELSILDVLHADALLFEKAALEALNRRLMESTA